MVRSFGLDGHRLVRKVVVQRASAQKRYEKDACKSSVHMQSSRIRRICSALHF